MMKRLAKRCLIAFSFLLVLSLAGLASDAQVFIMPTEADSLRQVSLSNLAQDSHTMAKSYQRKERGFYS